MTMYLKVTAFALATALFSLCVVESRERRYYSDRYSEDSELIQRFEKIEESEHKWELQFSDSIERLFWNQQKLADELIAKADESSSYALKRISSLYANIVCVRYAIGRKSIRMTKSVLEKQISSKDATITEESRLKEGETELFEKISTLRSMMDVHHSTISLWKLIHKLIEHYVKEESTAELKLLANGIYRERREFEVSALKMAQSFEQFAQAKGMNEAKLKQVLEHLDEIMSKADGDCSHCLSEVYQLHGNILAAKPKFGQKIDIVKLIESYVNPRLLKAINESSRSVEGKIQEPSAVEVEAVKLDDIEQLGEKITSFEY